MANKATKKGSDKQARNKKRMPGIKSRFKPGESGNPKGRPKKENTFSDTARDLLAATSIDISWTITDAKGTHKKNLKLESTKTMHHGIAAALIVESLKGNVQAVREIINRVEGKAVQPISGELKGDMILHFDKEAMLETDGPMPRAASSCDRMASTSLVKERVSVVEENAWNQKIRRLWTSQIIAPTGSITTASQSTCPQTATKPSHIRSPPSWKS